MATPVANSPKAERRARQSMLTGTEQAQGRTAEQTGQAAEDMAKAAEAIKAGIIVAYPALVEIAFALFRRPPDCLATPTRAPRPSLAGEP